MGKVPLEPVAVETEFVKDGRPGAVQVEHREGFERQLRFLRALRDDLGVPSDRRYRENGLFFNIGGPEPESTVAWFSSTGRFIADWMLQPGEAVVFHYRNFVGASQQVNLRSLVSFRLDTMLLGRFTFAVAVAAEQTGHLLLEARSLSAEAVAKDNIHTAMPERLVAWHANTAFQVASAQTLGSVYLDPFALARVKEMQPRGRMLVDTTPVRSFFYGTFRYALRVLSPL